MNLAVRIGLRGVHRTRWRVPADYDIEAPLSTWLVSAVKPVHRCQVRSFPFNTTSNVTGADLHALI